MAVWMQVFGEKKFESTHQALEVCQKVLPQVELDLSFLGEIAQPYSSSRWEISLQKDEQAREYVQAIYWLSEEKEIQSNQIRLYVIHDMVELLGPFEHFQAWNVIGEYEHLEQGYRKTVRALFTALGVHKAVYCSEWCFSNDEWNHTYQDLKQLMEQHPEWEVETLKGISANEYFIDRFE